MHDDGAADQDRRRPRLHQRVGQPDEVSRGPVLHLHGLLPLKHAFCEVDAVYTHKPPGGVAYCCSFRVTEAVHAIERTVDVLAQKLKMDPAELLRMKNFVPPERFPYRSALGWEYDSGNYPRRSRRRWR